MQGLIAFLIIVGVIILAILAIAGSFVFRIFNAMREAGARLRNGGDDEDYLRTSWDEAQEVEDDADGGSSQGPFGGYSGSSAGQNYGSGQGSTSGQNYGSGQGYGGNYGYESGGGYGQSAGSSSEQITIIDLRGPNANRRIYEDNEGEYVEFQEIDV